MGAALSIILVATSSKVKVSRAGGIYSALTDKGVKLANKNNTMNKKAGFVGNFI